MLATEDLFTPIHKALRSMIYSLSSRLQSNDFSDREATQALATDFENDFAIARSAGCILCVLSQHATDEETAIFPSVVGVRGDLITRFIEEHHDLTRRELDIAKSAHAILALDAPEDRIAAGTRLNQAANELFSAYIAHMNREETELVPFMREQFTNEQMAAMRGRIIGGMPPDRFFAVLGWMLPALNVTELTEMIYGLSRGAPPPVLRAVLDLGASKVDPARWAEMRRRTGL